MHRSGTSLVMRLLNIMGISVGPPESLLPADEHNIGGYWEHQNFMQINEKILKALGGSWDEPPESPRGWESATSPEMAALRRDARAVIDEAFGEDNLWGWKDPRNSLTLPFWRKLVPNMRCVACLRNPLDVTSSLQRRDGFSTVKSMDLWLHYTAASLENTSGLPTLFLFYEDLFDDWWGEVQRLARFMDIQLDDNSELKDQMRSVIEDELRHHHSTVVDALDTPELAVPAKSLYVALRSLVTTQQTRAQNHTGDTEFQESLEMLARYALTERRHLLTLEAQNSMLNEQLKEKDALLAEKERHIADKESHIANVESHIAKLESHIPNVEADLRHANAQAATTHHVLDQITNSAGYRLLERVRRPIRWLAPERTRRRLAFIALSRGLNILLTQGPWTFIRRAVQVWRWLPRLRRAPIADQQVSIDDQYQLWLKAHALTSSKAQRIRQEAAKLDYRPLISILTPVYNPDLPWLRDAIDSVRAQLYDHWELCITDDGSTRPGVHELLEKAAQADNRIKLTHLEKNQGIAAASNAALSLATGEFIGLLDHDDELKPDALFEVVKLLNERPDLDYIYTDEDKKEPDGRLIDPFFKSDWSPALLFSLNYVTHFSVFRKEIVDSLGGFRLGYDGSQDYDLILRVTETTDRIAHIPKPLYTWRKVPGSAASSPEAKEFAYPAAKRAIKDALTRRGVQAEVQDGPFKGYYRVRYAIPGKPRVSIIIPTRDRVDMLRRCIESIRSKSSYRNYEIIVIDNDSKEPETLEYLSSFPGRVIRYPHEFNFSRMMNEAAKQVECDALIFLNNDTEVISSEWIEAMLEHGMQPEVGAVGARLLFPDGQVQHEGILIGPGNGLAGNLDHHGYFGLGQVIRNCSAVTAACMLTRSSVFSELGGFDEEIGIAYNDVDFCLRAGQKGYLTVYTPYALLYHDEGGTRGRTGRTHPKVNEDMFRLRWGKYQDPYGNPNLDMDRPLNLRL